MTNDGDAETDALVLARGRPDWEDDSSASERNGFWRAGYRPDLSMVGTGGTAGTGPCWLGLRMFLSDANEPFLDASSAAPGEGCCGASCAVTCGACTVPSEDDEPFENLPSRGASAAWSA
jgi:hypothetical protein